MVAASLGKNGKQFPKDKQFPLPQNQDLTVSNPAEKITNRDVAQIFVANAYLVVVR